MVIPDTVSIQEEGTRTSVQEIGVTIVIVSEMAGKGETVGKQLGACKRGDNHLFPKHEEVIKASVHNKGPCPVFVHKDGINEKSKISDKMIQLGTNSKITVQEGVVGFGFEKGANKDCSANDLIMQESGTRKKVLQEKGISREKRYEKDATKAIAKELSKKIEFQAFTEKGLAEMGCKLLIKENMVQQQMEGIDRPKDSTVETFAERPVGEIIVTSEEQLLEQKVIDEEQERLVKEEQKNMDEDMENNLEDYNDSQTSNLDDIAADYTETLYKDTAPVIGHYKTYEKPINSLKLTRDFKDFFKDLKDKNKSNNNIESQYIDFLKDLNYPETYGQTSSKVQVYICIEGNQEYPNEKERDNHEDEDEMIINLNEGREIRSQQRLYNNFGLPRVRTISLRRLNGQMNPGQQLLSDSQQRRMNLLFDGGIIDLQRARQARQLHNGPMVDIQHMNPLFDGGLIDLQRARLERQLRNEPMVDIRQTRVSDICFQCGFSPARVWCTDCNNWFCVNCDAPFHGHPETRAHRRIWI